MPRASDSPAGTLSACGSVFGGACKAVWVFVKGWDCELNGSCAEVAVIRFICSRRKICLSLKFGVKKWLNAQHPFVDTIRLQLRLPVLHVDTVTVMAMAIAVDTAAPPTLRIPHPR
jgi:hypothetical protein